MFYYTAFLQDTHQCYNEDMYIALLGRQPELSIAELERLYGDVSWFSSQTALFTPPSTASFDVQKLGGTQKAGAVVLELPGSDWRKVSDAIVKHYTQQWKSHEGKMTLGLSAYDFAVSPREIQKTGLLLKAKLKQSGVSLRLVPNQEASLSTATSHHNKLGLADNKVELLIVKGDQGVIVAESVGAQNISALAARDQGRPRRDAFVGMLPPKLAQIMINLASPDSSAARILDPFCGTGVLLQEAALLGHPIYGTDLSEKMIRYSRDNINWLQDKYHLKIDWYLHEGDAMDTKWQQPIDAVASETYLGQPFSAPPSTIRSRPTPTPITTRSALTRRSRARSVSARLTDSPRTPRTPTASTRRSRKRPTRASSSSPSTRR